MGLCAGEEKFPALETRSTMDLLQHAARLELHPRQRQYAMDLLRSRQDAVAVLLQGLSAKPSIVRQVSTDLLGDVGTIECEEALLTAMQGEDLLVAVKASKALAEIYSRLPEAAFARRIALEPTPGRPQAVYSAALAIPRRLDGPDDPALPEAVEKRLLELLRAESSSLRAAAAEGLGYGSGEAIGKTLLDLLGTETETPVLRAACRSLARLRPPLEGDVLLKVIEEHDSPFLALDASRALDGLGYEGLHRAVTALLKDRRSRIREAAARTAGENGSPYAVPALIAACKDRSPRVRLAALEALGKISVADAGDTLGAMLSDADPRVRAEAARQLHRSGVLGAERGLLRDLESESLAAQAAAAQALGDLGIRQAVPALAKTIAHDDLELACRAAEALGAIGGPEATKALQSALADPRPVVVHTARQALAHLQNGK